MRLIDADALIRRAVAERDSVEIKTGCDIGYHNGLNMAVSMAINAPTLEAVVLPCKPGTTVYMLHNNTDACLDCPHHLVYFNDEECTHPEHGTYYPTIQDSPVCDKQFWEIIDCTSTELFLFNYREEFGRTVFPTRAEAEAALAKMKGLEVGA